MNTATLDRAKPAHTAWTREKPQRPGVYLWRGTPSRKAHRVLVSFEYTIRGEVGPQWLCYGVTDFAEMKVSGQWQFQEDFRTGSLPDFFVQARMQATSDWSEGVPTADGQYFWREHPDASPCVVVITRARSVHTGQVERFVRSYGHTTAPEFETLLATGQWAQVGVELRF